MPRPLARGAMMKVGKYRTSLVSGHLVRVPHLLELPLSYAATSPSHDAWTAALKHISAEIDSVYQEITTGRKYSSYLSPEMNALKDNRTKSKSYQSFDTICP